MCNQEFEKLSFAGIKDFLKRVYMSELSFISEMVKLAGVNSIGWIILIIYHRSCVDNNKDQLNAQTKREEKNLEFLQKMWQSNADSVKALLERIDFQSSQLTKIVEKIENNLWCPFIKNQTKESKGNNER